DRAQAGELEGRALLRGHDLVGEGVDGVQPDRVEVSHSSRLPPSARRPARVRQHRDKLSTTLGPPRPRARRAPPAGPPPRGPGGAPPGGRTGRWPGGPSRITRQAPPQPPPFWRWIDAACNLDRLHRCSVPLQGVLGWRPRRRPLPAIPPGDDIRSPDVSKRTY